MQPVTSTRELIHCQLGGGELKDVVETRFAKLAGSGIFGVKDFFWPSDDLLEEMLNASSPVLAEQGTGSPLIWLSESGALPAEDCVKIPVNDASFSIRYPWDLLKVNEIVIAGLSESRIDGEVSENVTIRGNIILGAGSVLLPGVYIEGNAAIGENCKIGPNCYIRGNTHIGNECHIGQAVEIKNSILMNRVSTGHLSYVGDSIIGEETNLGAGTITANFRHDGKKHRSDVNGELVDTGRRKFGCVMGDNAHTGIHTSVYPGRKIWPNASTLPGEIVKKDKHPE